MKTKHYLRSLLASAMTSALLLQAGVSYADDTEIFFGGSAIDSGIRPNVLFLLDDSGSMAYCTDSNKTDTCKTTSNQRMVVLKTTMKNLLDTTSGINAGLMVLNNRANSAKDPTLSRLLFPVTHIDAPYNLKLSSPEIKISADDASRYNGATNISDPTLLMGNVANPSPTNTVVRSLGLPNSYSNNNSTYYLLSGSGSTSYSCSVKMAATDKCPAGMIATLNASSGSQGRDGLLLFRNLNIPAGVTITSAMLEIKPTGNNGNTAFNVALVNSKTPGAFNHSDDTEEPVTVLFTGNSTVTSNKLGTGVHQLELKALLPVLQSTAPASNPIGDLAIRLRSRDSANFNYSVGDKPDAPVLTITYTGSENTQRSTGLRFQTVSVPQGATITSAKLSFVPASSDDRPVSFSVAAEASDNAAQFAVNEDFTNRSKTTATIWKAPEWRTQSPPVLNEGADVTAQVQSVVNRGGWCGNKAMAFFLTPDAGDGSRTAISQDGHNGLKPALNISYTGGDAGCIEPIAEVSLVDAKDDARQYYKNGSNPTEVDLNGNTLPFSSKRTDTILGARFQKLPFKAGAQVLEASVIVTPDSAAGTQVKADAYFEQVSNSAPFSNNKDNLGKRTPLTSKTSCTFISQGPGIPVECQAAGLASALQSVLTSSNGWKDGNALSVFLAQTSAPSSLELRAYETSPADTIRLRVKLSNGSLSDNSYKVRDHLKGLVDSMEANGFTPIIPQLTQAAQYYTDLSGKHKGPPSPIESSCQTNFLVLMTDGQANDNDAISAAESLTGTTCTSRGRTDGETCGTELASWLNKTDQSSTVPDKNLVSTHTIGFALQSNNAAKQFLTDVAAAGGGKAYDASNASELAKAFNNILQEVLSTNTSFVNTSAPVNSFNRADNLDELYFALFRPSGNDRWAGNLKRYRMKIEGDVATIVDADDTPAIDSKTGFFKGNARSFWNSGQDGSDIAKGGAAHKLPLPNSRNLLTYIGSSGATTDLVSLSIISEENLGNSNMTPGERDTLRDYIKGVDVDSTASQKPARYALGDPIHSSPRLVVYGCNAYTAGECTSPDLSAVMGSNEGFVHAFDTDTGVEEFAFMPEALLPNIKQLRENQKSSSKKPRLYGMDNTVTVWANDANNNGVIYGNPNTGATSGLNSGEFVYAYATMGRGGRNIYALDITNRSAPKFLWQIIGGSTPGFEKLGQTWSTPVKTRIDVGGTIKDVLIFAGGYDVKQDELNDSTSVRTPDTEMGNAIYIVDAKTGEKIWSASQDNTVGTHDQVLAKMQYSIPSPVRVIDIQEANGILVNDAEKLADQFFVGDMGGQVWRFYINNGSSGSSLISPAGTGGDGVFASIGGDVPASARRFYNEPDVSLLNVNGARSLAVSIGSGYRGHPLNEYIEDRFYAFRTATLFKTSGEGTLTESDLYNATQNLIQAGSAAQKDAAKTAFKQTTGGWYIKLTNSGEKVLSRALTAGGVLYFNTYEPSISSAACSAAVGKNRSYSVRLLNATPASVTVDGNGTPGDRADSSNSEGIAGDPQLFCQGDKCWVLKDPSLAPDPVDAPPPGKTYWMDSSNL